MGRRALRKTDPAIELALHLRAFDELPAAGGLGRVFGRDAPLEIEVGTGKGLFLANAAENDPNANFAGIEVARKYARFAAARLARAELPNAVVLLADAARVFAEHVAPGSVRAVHVYFPDPWWKKRHHKRRIWSETFIGDVARALEPGGRLHFWTDVEDYFTSSVALIHRTSGLAGPFAEPCRPAEHDLDYRTHFERRVRLHAEPVYRARFEKPLADANPPPAAR